MIAASFPFTLAYITMLYGLHTTHIPIPFIAIVQGCGAGLYWFSLHSFFASNAQHESIGASVGKLFGFPQIAGLFGPLIGGAIALHYGFPVLLALGGFILLLSTIPLLWIPRFEVQADFSARTFLNLFKQFRRYTLIEFVENIREELEAVIWPLFIFLTFKNALSVGFVGTLAAVGSITFTFAVGKYTDRINPKIFMRIGALSMALLWLVRYAWPQIPLLLYISTLVAGFLASLIEIPFTSFIYGSAKRTNIPEFIVYREFPVTLARIGVYSIALVLANVTDLFLVGGIVSALILLF